MSGNVIDLKSRRTIQSPVSPSESSQVASQGSSQVSPLAQSSRSSGAAVLDISERRSEMMLQERRQIKRTILSEFIGAFVIVPKQGLQKIAVYDISETGVAFDLPLAAGSFAAGEELAMRVYMNQHTYFAFVAKVRNARRIEDEGVVRHGAGFVKGTVNDVALHHFVRFIENVSASLETDNGDVMVSNI